METKEKKIKITIEIDIGRLQEGCWFLMLLFGRLLYFPVVLLLYFIVGDKAFTQRQRFEAYTAKKKVTQQKQEAKEGEEELFYTTSWDIYQKDQTKCLHPSCENTFQKVMRGNQPKRFCSQKCKDDFHNKNRKQATI